MPLQKVQTHTIRDIAQKYAILVSISYKSKLVVNNGCSWSKDIEPLLRHKLNLFPIGHVSSLHDYYIMTNQMTFFFLILIFRDLACGTFVKGFIC